MHFNNWKWLDWLVVSRRMKKNTAAVCHQCESITHVITVHYTTQKLVFPESHSVFFFFFVKTTFKILLAVALITTFCLVTVNEIRWHECKNNLCVKNTNYYRKKSTPKKRQVWLIIFKATADQKASDSAWIHITSVIQNMADEN